MKDAQMAIAFLTTIVRNLDKDDWNELRRLIGYLKKRLSYPDPANRRGKRVKVVGGRIICSS